MPHSLEETLTRAGARVTPQRRSIIALLAASSDHPTAEILHLRLRERGVPVSLATVYRTLRVLCQAGLVQEHDFGDGALRFEADRGDQHGHLVDLSQGGVFDFVDDRLTRLLGDIADHHGYGVVASRVSILARPLGSTTLTPLAPRLALSSGANA